jgi:hypothetical protein
VPFWVVIVKSPGVKSVKYSGGFNSQQLVRGIEEDTRVDSVMGSVAHLPFAKDVGGVGPNTEVAEIRELRHNKMIVFAFSG